MKRIFTHWFLIGDTLSTYPTMADGFGDAASKFGANVKGITAPGYSVVKDEVCTVQISHSVAEIKAQAIEEFCCHLKADHYLDKTVHDAAVKRTNQLRSQSRLTETQQAANRILDK